MSALRQWTHSRHCGENSVTTWSPTASERDAVADPLDDAGALVPEHGRRVAGRVGARGGVEIGVADAAGDEPHEHLAGSRLGQIDLAHDERGSELLEHGGPDLHRPILVARVRQSPVAARNHRTNDFVPSRRPRCSHARTQGPRSAMRTTRSRRSVSS